jgi:type II secretory pathway component GspD/PulD (secretin)
MGGGFFIPRVDVTGAGGGMGGMGGGGMGGGGYGGGGGGGGYGGGGGGYGGGGLGGITRTNNMSYANEMVRAYFSAAGVDLGGTNVLGGGGLYGGGGFQGPAGKAVFFNDRSGLLMVRATMEDLDIIDAAIQVLNKTPDMITIEAKFLEIGQEDSKALGFDWYLGNTLLGGGKMGLSGGTAPSYTGTATGANPYGVFPGSGSIPLVPATGALTDEHLTAGLRGTTAEGTQIPTVATLTGILTDPQFRVVLKALEQRSGVDVLAAPSVTTVSGRQTQIQVVDIQTIVMGISAGAAGGGLGGYGGAVGGGYGGGGAVGGVAR